MQRGYVPQAKFNISRVLLTVWNKVDAMPNIVYEIFENILEENCLLCI